MNQKPDPILLSLVGILLLVLTYAGILAYQSIDFKILEKLEASPLNLPTQTNPTPQIPQPHSSSN